MIKKILGRSVGGTAVAGLVLTAAPVAVVAPQIVPVACPYPPAIQTSTSLTLTRPVAQWGSVTRANVSVTSGSGTPSGQVRILVNGKARSTITLSGGSGSAVLPRGLKARKTHAVVARFVEDCTYGASTDSANYTVVKARAKITAKVVKAKKAKFKAKVKSRTGLPAKNGKAVFKVKKKSGATVRTAIRKVRQGVARANLRDLGKGRYILKVRYLGNKNIKPGKRSKSFRVR